MKKSTRLKLAKETLSHLTAPALKRVGGGGLDTGLSDCVACRDTSAHCTQWGCLSVHVCPGSVQICPSQACSQNC